VSICELSGKKPIIKNLVSHSNIKTKKQVQPNVQKKRIFSKSLNQMVRLSMATSTIRSMEHQGGLDPFIVNQKDSLLSPRALEVKRRILSKMRSSKATSNLTK
jgi:large subunit ribosomal protein L28